MKEWIYAVAGSFAMKPGALKGIHVFRYEAERGTFAAVGDYRTELNIGQQCGNPQSGVLYAVHEWKHRKGEWGGGGCVAAFRLDPETGEPEWLNEKDSCACQPSDICLDGSGRYGLVSHHGSEDVVTKTRKKKDGGYEAVTECDDCTLALFRIEEDGKLGEICDVAFHDAIRRQGGIQKVSHLHNCVMSPGGEFFAVCDKGLDKIYSYRLDKGRGRLCLAQETTVEEGSRPRYGAFHPRLPVFYQNNENYAYLNVWNYDGSGKLNRMQQLPLLFDEKAASAWTKEGASDLTVTEDGRTLYVSVRGLNLISVFELDDRGKARLIQSIGCQGENPRGLCLDPAQRYLFAANRNSNCISRFRREKDGTLTPDGQAAECRTPGNLQFAVYKQTAGNM